MIEAHLDTCHMSLNLSSSTNYHYYYYSHFTGQPVLASSPSIELEDFVGAKFYCLRALADGNWHIRIGRRC